MARSGQAARPPWPPKVSGYIWSMPTHLEGGGGVPFDVVQAEAAFWLTGLWNAQNVVTRVAWLGVDRGQC